MGISCPKGPSFLLTEYEVYLVWWVLALNIKTGGTKKIDMEIEQKNECHAMEASYGNPE